MCYGAKATQNFGKEQLLIFRHYSVHDDTNEVHAYDNVRWDFETHFVNTYLGTHRPKW